MDNDIVISERIKLSMLFKNIMKFEESGPSEPYDGWKWRYINIIDIKTGCQIGQIKYWNRDNYTERYSWKTYDEKFYYSDPDWISKNHIRLAYFFQCGGFLPTPEIDFLLKKADQIRHERLKQRQEWRAEHPIARRRHGLHKACIMPLVLKMLREEVAEYVQYWPYL